MPNLHRDPDGFYLGVWVGRQRTLRYNYRLSAARTAALEPLGMNWEHWWDSFEFYHLVARAVGHLPVGDDCADLGAHEDLSLSRYRTAAHGNRMPFVYARALAQIDPWWDEVL